MKGKLTWQEIKEKYSGLKKGLKKGGTWTIANLAIRRELNDWDTIIVIIGQRGAGKSNLGLKIISNWLEIKKEEGMIDGVNWKKYWKENFALSTIDAIEKYRKLKERSFLFIDEGADVAYSSDTMTLLVRNLIKLLAKMREKKIFTIICLPFLDMLTKRVLEMTHLLIVVPYRFKDLWSYAFVYARNPNPLVSGDGYGFDKAKKILEKGLRLDYMMSERWVVYKGEKIREVYPKMMFRKLMSLPSFKMMFRYRPVKKELENAYKKYVKSKILNQELHTDLVPRSKFAKLEYMYNTLLYNLYEKDGKSLKQLERLHIDKFGNILLSAGTIKKRLDKMAMTEKPLSEDIIKEKIFEEEIEESDIFVSGASESPNAVVNGESKRNKTEKQIHTS